MRRLACLALGLVLAPHAAAVAETAQPARPAPALTLAGPYGDPLALRPSLVASEVARLPSPAVLPASAGVAEPDPWSGAERRPGAAPARGAAPSVPNPDEEHLPPVHPGTFRPGQTVIPGFPDKNRVVAPHLTPDIEIARTRRATLGLFGEVQHVEVETRPGSLPSVKPQGLGAGLSFQYRLGE